MTFDKPKRLTGLNQKVRGLGAGLLLPFAADKRPPADRRSLTRSGMIEERGKPAVLSWPGSPRAVRNAYGTAGRGREEKANAEVVMTPDRECVSHEPHPLPRKRADFFPWCSHTRKSG